MTNNTPINQTHETFKDRLERTIAGALHTIQNEDIELPVFHQQNWTLIKGMADGWLNCKCDTIEGLARALAYSTIGKQYEINRLDAVGELHYSYVDKKYWHTIVNYVNERLSGLM